MPKLPNMPLWVYDIDTDRDCRAMTDAEFGRYMRLLIRQWIEGCVPARVDAAVRDAMLDPGSEESVQALLDRKFSDRDDGHRRNPKCHQMRLSVLEKVQKNRESGRKGGLKRTLSERLSESEATRGSDSDSGSDSSGEGKKYTEDFERFWSAYPKKTAKHDAAKAWRKHPDRPDADALIATVKLHAKSRQWRDGVIPHASTWLNQRRWEDDMGGDAAPPKGIAALNPDQQQALYEAALRANPDLRSHPRGSDSVQSAMKRIHQQRAQG